VEKKEKSWEGNDTTAAQKGYCKKSGLVALDLRDHENVME